MNGRQRILSVLQLDQDGTLRLIRKKDNAILFQANANEITYSGGKFIKPRLRLVTPTKGMRIGVWPIDDWKELLLEHGAKEDPKHPEEKLDMYGLGIVCVLILIIVLAVIMPLITK